MYRQHTCVFIYCPPLSIWIGVSISCLIKLEMGIFVHLSCTCIFIYLLGNKDLRDKNHVYIYMTWKRSAWLLFVTQLIILFKKTLCRRNWLIEIPGIICAQKTVGSVLNRYSLAKLLPLLRSYRFEDETSKAKIWFVDV